MMLGESMVDGILIAPHRTALHLPNDDCPIDELTDRPSD